MYLYESHMGGLYTDDEWISYDDLYCETCGDSDNCLGEFKTVKEFWELIKDKCNINGSGGYALQYIYPFMIYEFGLPDQATYEDGCDKEFGFCNNSEDEILKFIEEAILRWA